MSKALITITGCGQCRNCLTDIKICNGMEEKGYWSPIRNLPEVENVVGFCIPHTLGISNLEEIHPLCPFLIKE